jgi:hypothetical protein
MFMKRPYLIDGRLADVLALIQVLAIDEHAHRSEDGLASELQGNPRSSSSWRTVAQAHPEFFRVKPDGDHVVSLVARHVMPKEADGRRPLASDYASKLMELAVELHDREISRGAAWRSALQTLMAVIIGGALGIVGSIFTANFQSRNQAYVQDVQKARDVYSRLTGRKAVTTQLQLTSLQNAVYINYLQTRRLMKLESSVLNEAEEAPRLIRENAAVALDVAKNEQGLFEDLGVVRALFQDSPELRLAIEAFSNVPPIELKTMPTGLTEDAIDEWREQATNQLGKDVEARYGARFDRLLTYLITQPLLR